MSKLTAKQLIFCKEYLIDKNATRASVEAGYSKKTAEVQGSRMLRNVKVKEYIDTELEKMMNKLDISADRVMQELANIAFFDIRNIFDSNDNIQQIKDLDESTARAIGSVKFKQEKTDGENFAETMEVKANDKLRALDMLMKNMGMYESDNKQKDNKDGTIKSIKVTYE